MGRTSMVFRAKMLETRSRMLAITAGGLCLLFALYVFSHSFMRHTSALRALAKSTTEVATVGSSQPRVPELKIRSLIQHGDIVEISRLHSHEGSLVMINGQIAATIFEGNAFRYFLGPLRAGTTIITVTSQNEEGGVNTQKVAVTIE